MNPKDLLLRRIRQRAIEEAKYLAGEFARAASEEKEEILAHLEFERWMADSCRDAVVGDPEA
jgi:vacuolar-type H+-ATPase subunit E/Vma4